MDVRSPDDRRPVRRLFFSVGEPSGDIHGGNLIRELRRLDPTVECVGYGGPRMQQAGATLQFDLTQLAVMWFAQAILNIHRFWMLYRQADRYFRAHPVDAVILIDFPGFNWWMARAAKRHNIPVYYYGAPQMWAWAGWRIHKMKRLVDVALCKLPFETRWYQQRGMRAVDIGHPFYDEVARHQVDEAFLDQQRRQTETWLLLLPGSRRTELERNLPTLLAAVDQLHPDFPHLGFALSCVSPEHAQWCQEQMTPAQRSRIQVTSARTADWMRLAKVCLACSGSVSLELMNNVVPTVIVYRIGRWATLGIGLLMKVKYVTLVNLLWTPSIEKTTWSLPHPEGPDAEDVPFPEYVTTYNPAEQVARRLATWLRDERVYQAKRQQLQALRDQLAHPGTSQRAARWILEQLASPTPQSTVSDQQAA